MRAWEAGSAGDRVEPAIDTDSSSSSTSSASHDTFEARVSDRLRRGEDRLRGAAAESEDDTDHGHELEIDSPDFLLQGKRSLRVWRAARIGANDVATLRFRSSWTEHVVNKLSGKDKEFAVNTLDKILQILRMTDPPRRLARSVTIDAIYVTCSAAYGVRRGAGVARSYERDGIPRELRRRIQVQAWLDGGAPLAESADRSAARQAGADLPGEDALTSAAARRDRAGNRRRGGGRGNGTSAPSASPAVRGKSAGGGRGAAKRE
jgi:hypothetical protein